MKRTSTRDFLNHSSSRSKRTGFYAVNRDAPEIKNGVRKTFGVIHPDGGINPRSRHGSFQYSGDDGGSKWAQFNCAGVRCPLCLLDDFSTEVIDSDHEAKGLAVLTHVDANVTFGDLIYGGYWKRRVSKVSDGVLFAWIPAKSEFDANNPVRIFGGTAGVMYELQRMIRNECEDNGDDKGDPLSSPYLIAVRHDSNAADNRKRYSVSRPTSGVIADEINDIIDVSLERLGVTYPSTFCEPGDVREMLSALENSWLCDDIPFSDFLKFYESKYASVPNNNDKQPNVGKRIRRSNDTGRNRTSRNNDTDVKIVCDGCESTVVPDDGRCPECMYEIDVPF